jgi:hypothetical protein
MHPMNELDQAADRVLSALRARDAYRHSSAPTLEREYQRALEAYFDVAEAARGRSSSREEVVAAPVVEPEASDPRADEVEHLFAAVAAYYVAARQALRLARAYREELGTSGRRERECLEAVGRHRDAIRRTRLALRRNGEQLALPGLVKTRPAAQEAVRVAGAG